MDRPNEQFARGRHRRRSSQQKSTRCLRHRRKRAFVIVASRFNATIRPGPGRSRYRANCASDVSPDATISLHQVPGAFEIPDRRPRDRARKKKPTRSRPGRHPERQDRVTRKISPAPSRTRCSTSRSNPAFPVINAVLSLETEAQARERCLEDKINRGTEAARAAVEIANVMAELRAKQAHGKTARGPAGGGSISFLARPQHGDAPGTHGRILGILSGHAARARVRPAAHRRHDRAPAGDRRAHPHDTARTTNSAASPRSIATFCGSRFMKCFTATTFRRSFRSTKRSSWRRHSAARIPAGL